MHDARSRATTTTTLRGRDKPTLICFSHLRWDFVFQRPQHLMTRFARDYNVAFWEEPEWGAPGEAASLVTRLCSQSGVNVVTPRLSGGLAEADQQRELRALLDRFLAGTKPDVSWYYTPMMLPFSEHLSPGCTVYDCMDELANFRGAPPELLGREERLLGTADLVFTGGYSLYEAKKGRHPAVHPFPSSVDVDHFAAATPLEPEDQAGIARPRLGFFGVIDERLNIDLLAALADARPEWSIVMVGPVVKISPDDLPRRPNIHYLGGKDYTELPGYIHGWDAALMPFALNEATRFISPTKTPEYLAAGKPVVSTAIRDVARHYGGIEGVRIAQSSEEFIAGCKAALKLEQSSEAPWRKEADAMLVEMSWDSTQERMFRLIAGVLDAKRRAASAAPAIRTGFPHDYDVLVVGAGFAGAVMAERLAADGGKRVLVIDSRPHLAGNAYDRADGAGVLIHQYGPHIFHTNSDDIFAYLSRFTEWRPYEHRVLADVGGQLLPMPINRTTLNALYGLNLANEAEAAAFLASRAEPVATVRTSRDVVIEAVGRDLYETFFEGYTRKQWGLDPSQLDKSVTSRVPTRTSTDDRYFLDKHQAMPLHGYTRMFERMLDHPLIDLALGTSFADVRERCRYDHLVFTGPIDEFFDYRYGPLPYRSLEFVQRTLAQEWLQPVAVVNYPSEQVPYTRVTEYKHLTGQQAPQTSVTYEYPSATGAPYYPIPRTENQALFRRYKDLADERDDVTFVGRLATYRYYNMDQVVGQALAAYRRLAERRRPNLNLRSAAITAATGQGWSAA